MLKIWSMTVKAFTAKLHWDAIELNSGRLCVFPSNPSTSSQNRTITAIASEAFSREASTFPSLQILGWTHLPSIKGMSL